MRTSPTRAGAILVGLIALLLTAAVPAVAVGPLLTGGDDRVLVAQEPVESPLPGSDVPATPIPAPTPGPDLAAALGALLAQLPAALSDAILARPSETDASPSTLSPPISYGADGRFTLLLIGSDWRAHSGGERTDVLLVMSIDPITKRVAAASLPRDIVYFPRAPKNGGGTSGRSRINTMYYGYRRSGLKHVAVDRKALVALKRDVAFTLDTEIDGYVMIRFNGFVGLINRIKWLAVDIPAAINDPYYRKTHGVYFPVATKYRLKGNPPCADKPARCHSALAYARSRKGTVGTGSNGDSRARVASSSW